MGYGIGRFSLSWSAVATTNSAAMVSNCAHFDPQRLTQIKTPERA